MSVSYFYIDRYEPSQKEILLDEETSYHIVKVLRINTGEELYLTDGKGNLISAQITAFHKKHCIAEVKTSSYRQPASSKSAIAISLIKNSSRFEWFLEKAAEIGVTEIIPLICERTIKEKFRYDRMRGICVSAMLQSQQSWLPLLHEPIAYELLFRQEEVAGIEQKFIAHCLKEEKQNLTNTINKSLSSQIILIGPEGDFSKKEIDLATQNHFIPVTLGETRLRTETAGVVAATLLKLI